MTLSSSNPQLVIAGSNGLHSARMSAGGDPREDPLAAGFDGLAWHASRRSVERRKSRLYAKAGLIWGTSKILKANRKIK